MAREEHLALLKLGPEKWNGWRRENPGEVVDLTGADLTKKDLRGFDLSKARLMGAQLTEALLDRANLSSANLKNAVLAHASLNDANLTHSILDDARLAFAGMEKAVLLFASMKRADLRGAHLKEASLEDAVLRKANFSHAHLENAFLSFSDCTGADFMGADLTGVNLTAVNLERSNVAAVRFDSRILWKLFKKTAFNPLAMWRRRSDFILDTTIRCKGVHAGCYGSQKFASFLKGQDFLEEMMEDRKGRITCTIWWLLADCGRSFLRWGFWSCLIICLFAGIYVSMGPGSFQLAVLPFGPQAMLYYSVVIFSTLGFGDIVPRTPIAVLLTGLEVLTGYFMMGGLISIFTTKLRVAK